MSYHGSARTKIFFVIFGNTHSLSDSVILESLLCFALSILCFAFLPLRIWLANFTIHHNSFPPMKPRYGRTHSSVTLCVHLKRGSRTCIVPKTKREQKTKSYTSLTYKAPEKNTMADTRKFSY